MLLLCKILVLYVYHSVNNSRTCIRPNPRSTPRVEPGKGTALLQIRLRERYREQQRCTAISVRRSYICMAEGVAIKLDWGLSY